MTPEYAGQSEELVLAQRVFEQAYEFEKHLDDKIGRFLTAVAFLATAAAALVATTNMLAVRFALPGKWTVPLPAILFVSFFTVLGLVVSLLLGSLGPNTTFAGPSTTASSAPTLLFALQIAKYKPGDWKGDYRAQLKDSELSTNFYDESHNVALNTEFKYHRNNEALSLFRFGLLLFVLAVTLGAYGLAQGTHAASGALVSGWPIDLRCALAVEIACFVILQTLELHWLRQSDVWAKEGKRHLNEDVVFLLLGIATVGFSCGCVFAAGGSADRLSETVVALSGTLAAVLGSYVISNTGWREGRWFLLGTVSVLTVGGVLAIALGPAVLVLAFSLIPPVMLGLPRLFRSWFVWREKFRLQ